MEKNVKVTSLKRIAVSMLVLLMVVSCMPLMEGRSAYAAEKEGGVDIEGIELTDEQQKQLEKGKIELTQDQIDKLNEDEEETLTGGDDSVIKEGKSVDVESVDLDKIPVDKSLAGGEKGMSLNGSGTSDDEGYEDDEPRFEEFIYSSAYPEINTGDTKTCQMTEFGQIATFKFTAPSNGTYWFSAGGNYDTMGRLVEYDSETGKYRQKKCDDNGYQNFGFSFKAAAGKTYYLQAAIWDLDVTGSFTVTLTKEPDADSIKLSVDTSKNKSSHVIYVTASVDGATFDDIYIDGEAMNAGVNGQSSFTRKAIDMKAKTSVGIHTLSVKLKEHTDIEKVYQYGITTYIYKKPSISISEFLTTYKRVAYHYTGSWYDDCNVYFTWKKKKGGKWSKTLIGPVKTTSSEYTAEPKNLKASTKYSVKTCFGKTVKYGGKYYNISGSQTGYYSSTKTVKTAGKKPKIKKVKVSKVSQKTRKLRGWHYGTWSDPVYGWHFGLIYGPYKSTTTKFNIAVTLKKKPNAKGLYIGSKKVKGNNKTYKAKFNMSGKRKGKKLTFEFASYQSTKYSSYSPIAKKKVKIK